MSFKKASPARRFDPVGYVFVLALAVSLLNSLVTIVLAVLAALLVVCLMLRPRLLLTLLLTGSIFTLMRLWPLACALAVALVLLAVAVKIVIGRRLRNHPIPRLADRSGGLGRAGSG